jgi:hypothetical protein
MSTQFSPQGIPLRPDPRQVRRFAVNAMMRAASAIASSQVWNRNAERVAQERWPSDQDVQAVIKGAVTPATTASAAALMRTLTSDFISSLGPISAGAELLGMGLQLKFDGAGAISIPGFVADPAKSGFVKEADPIPVKMLTSAAALLDPSKLATICALSREMAESSNAEKLIEDALSRSTALALDAALFDANAAVADTRPAGLRYGIAGLTPTAGGGLNAMLGDLGNLLSVVSAVSGNTLPVLVTSPARASKLRLLGGYGLQATTILASSAIAATDVIAIAPGAIVSAMSNAPVITVSTETVLHMADPASAIGTAGSPNTVAAPSTSMFQHDVLAIKCRMEASWARRDDRAVAWLSGATW